MQINRQYNGAIIAICHEADEEEAKRLAKHLCTLTEAYFGKSALRWFDTETKEIAKSKTYNKITQVIKVKYDKDNLEVMNRLACWNQAIKDQSKVLKNGTMEPFELLDDSDEDTNIGMTNDPCKVHLLYTYPLNSMFKLTPPDQRSAQQFDDKSFESNGTGDVTTGSVYSLTLVLSVSTGSSFSTTNSTDYQLNTVLELSSSDTGSEDDIVVVDDENKMSDEFKDMDTVMSKSGDNDLTGDNLNIISGLGSGNTAN